MIVSRTLHDKPLKEHLDLSPGRQWGGSTGLALEVASPAALLISHVLHLLTNLRIDAVDLISECSSFCAVGFNATWSQLCSYCDHCNIVEAHHGGYGPYGTCGGHSQTDSPY